MTHGSKKPAANCTKGLQERFPWIMLLINLSIMSMTHHNCCRKHNGIGYPVSIGALKSVLVHQWIDICMYNFYDTNREGYLYKQQP